MNIKKFTASLHTHVRSQFDAQINATSLCNKIIALGGKGCAITDHGVVSSIEDYRYAFSDSGLKLIPGVEMYVDGKLLGRLHLILLAVDDLGWKGVCRLVTDANMILQDGFPVISVSRLFEVLKEYRGHIIGTSACIQGVVAAILLQNEKVQHKIDKLIAKQGKVGIDPGDIQVLNAETARENAVKILNDAIATRDKTKALAEMKFSKREKVIEKLIKEGKHDEANLLIEELSKDKIASEVAKKELPEKKTAVDKAKKALSIATKHEKEFNLLVDKYLDIEVEIDALKAEMKPEEELISKAKETALKFSKAFGKENFFMELQYHGIPQEKYAYPILAQIAKECEIPLVATNDVHILENSDDERLRRQILRSLRFGTDFKKEDIGDDQLYLKDNHELAESLLEILSEDIVEEAINNIDVIFDRCTVEFKHETHYPKFKVKGKTSEEFFDEAIAAGIKWRFPDGMDEIHKKRLEYEVSIIKSMGYVDYHLVVKDFLEYGRLLGFVPSEKVSEAPLSIEELKLWIKENGWKNGGLTIGPGRGSAVGSLVCYLLGITALDPLKYGLLFERFLNPERVSMPDIDSDLSKGVREKTIEYVQTKYGENAVCGIMTTNAQAPKGAIRIAAKYYGFYKYGTELTSLGDAIAKKVPGDVGLAFDTKTKDGKTFDPKNKEGKTLYNILCEEYSNDEDALEVLRWAKVVEGSFTAYGAHAAGIVISDNDDISEYLPLRWNSKLDMWTTQCDMVQVEENGLLKFDFLGLKTLDIITNAIRMIEKNHGIIVDPLKIDLNDRAVYDAIFAQGKTNSVFQFESAGMKSMLQQFGPECFEDIIILISMFRPGPIQYLDDVIAVKNKRKPMAYLCDELKPILGKTYAAIVYQEQVMEICQKLAGYTLGQADNVRRFMTKKKADKLAHEKQAFVYGDVERGIKGCIANGVSENAALKLFEQMEDFAKYAFNKSHAAAYAFNAFITAWLKYYYPAEFFAAAMNWADNDGIAALMYDASTFGVEVLAPDINESLEDFSITDGKIRFGLSSVAGVKEQAKIIIKERNNGLFTSLKSFYKRVSPNRTVAVNLIAAGAFDALCSNRAAMTLTVDYISDSLKKVREKESFINSAEAILPYVNSLKSETALIQKQNELGVKIELKEVTTVDKLEKRISNAKSALVIRQEEFDNIEIPDDMPEDKIERMKKERELLGIYVTEHPMDYYPAPAEVGALPINETQECKDTFLYGVITNLEIKNRKSDGKPMAFFQLEDRSGNMDVCVFTKAYEQNKNYLEEGAVVLLAGNCNEEESFFTDEEGNAVTIKKFYATSVRKVSESKTTYFLSVPSFACFHTFEEQSFRKRYEEENGHALIIHDLALDQMREMTYKVSDYALSLCKEL